MRVRIPPPSGGVPPLQALGGDFRAREDADGAVAVEVRRAAGPEARGRSQLGNHQTPPSGLLEAPPEVNRRRS